MDKGCSEALQEARVRAARLSRLQLQRNEVVGKVCVAAAALLEIAALLVHLESSSRNSSALASRKSNTHASPFPRPRSTLALGFGNLPTKT